MKKLYKRILRRIFGKCFVDGHNLKMERGWQVNPDYGFVEGELDMSRMFKSWIFYRCKRCPAIFE